MAKRHTCPEGVSEIVLNRKPKKRYLAVMHTGQGIEAFDALSKRCAELFGYLALEKARLRLMSSDKGVMIIRCGLDQIHDILVSIALTNPPMSTTGISGSIRRLRARIDG